MGGAALNVGFLDHCRHRNPSDKNVVTVWFEWDTMERAQAWGADEALANGMTAAGMISIPVFSCHDIKSTTDKMQVALERR